MEAGTDGRAEGGEGGSTAADMREDDFSVGELRPAPDRVGGWLGKGWGVRYFSRPLTVSQPDLDLFHASSC